jgi:serine/threonine-protein kinase
MATPITGSHPTSPPGGDTPIRWPAPGDEIRNPVTGMGYVLGRVLGEGSFGVTFECTSEFAEPLVAKYLKPFRPRGQTEQDWLKEAHLMGLVRHPYIVHIFDWFEYGNLYYIICERAWGSIRDLVARHGAFAPPAVVEFGRQLLSALHFMHGQRVIHRDLQIDNVLYVGEAPHIALKISDFGISRKLGGEEGYAFTNVGRAFDVAPELICGGYTSIQSDLYQVGLLLYFLLTGTVAVGAHDGPVEQAIASGIAHQRALAVGGRLGQCLSIMLAVDDRARYRDALAAWYALRDAV